MIYGCTSGTIANGADSITRLIRDVRPEAEVTTPATAAIAAFKHLGVRRISLLTPYIKELNVEVLQYFEQHGLEVLSLTGLDFDDDVAISGIAGEDLFQVASTAVAAGSEALFLSCTALRTASVIDRLEQKLGIPVVSSNLALAWHSSYLTNSQAPMGGTGCLMAAEP